MIFIIGFSFFNKKIGKNLAYRFCKNTINRSDKLVLDLLKPECLKKIMREIFCII